MVRKRARIIGNIRQQQELSHPFWGKKVKLKLKLKEKTIVQNFRQQEEQESRHPFRGSTKQATDIAKSVRFINL